MGANFKIFTFGHIRDYIVDIETWAVALFCVFSYVVSSFVNFRCMASDQIKW